MEKRKKSLEELKKEYSDLWSLAEKKFKVEKAREKYFMSLIQHKKAKQIEKQLKQKSKKFEEKLLNEFFKQYTISSLRGRLEIYNNDVDKVMESMKHLFKIKLNKKEYDMTDIVKNLIQELLSNNKKDKS